MGERRLKIELVGDLLELSSEHEAIIRRLFADCLKIRLQRLGGSYSGGGYSGSRASTWPGGCRYRWSSS
jgi:hypothetical protein